MKEYVKYCGEYKYKKYLGVNLYDKTRKRYTKNDDM